MGKRKKRKKMKMKKKRRKKMTEKKRKRIKKNRRKRAATFGPKISKSRTQKKILTGASRPLLVN